MTTPPTYASELLVAEIKRLRENRDWWYNYAEVEMLDMQKEYFATKNRQLLGECKEKEAEVREYYQLIINQQESKVLL